MSEPQDKYWKSTVTIEVLSRRPYPPVYDSDLEIDLDQLAYDVVDGECSGKVIQTNVEVTEEEMVKLLQEQGSDSQFLVPEKRS